MPPSCSYWRQWPAITTILGWLILAIIPINCLAQLKSPSPATQGSQQPENAATEVPPSGPTIARPELVDQVEKLTRFLQEINGRLSSDSSVSELSEALAGIEASLRREQQKLSETLESQPTLSELAQLEREWLARRAEYAVWRPALDQRAKDLDNDRARLDEANVRWQQTLKTMEGDVTLSEIANRVRQQLEDIQTTRAEVLARTDQIVLLQNRLSLQEYAVSDAVEKIDGVARLRQRSLFERDSEPLWLAQPARPRALRAAYHREWQRFSQFVNDRRRALYALTITFLVALVIALKLKRNLPRLLQRRIIDPETANRFDNPVSLALLVSLVGIPFLGPDLPIFVRYLTALLFLVPFFRLVVREMNPELRPLAYALLVSVGASAMRELVGAPTSRQTRIVSLALWVVSIGVFIWLLRRSRPYFDRVSGWPRLVLLAIRAGLLLLLVSVVANLFGYVALSTALKVGVIISCYLALFLYTVRQIAIDSLPLILGTPPVALLGAVRLHKRTIQSWLSRLLALAALFVWFYAALGLFSIRKGVSDAVGASLTQPLLFGRVSLSLQDVLFFLLTLFAGITLARVVRALLEEDVLPHLSLRRGVPNTISTLTHFGLATAGFFLSLAVVGVEFSRLTVLTGALGIGVGFGLQTIVSNFASGLMLLLVRPIIVGDVVEAEGLAGEVKRIGLYSSTVRTAQGAEVIVPNTNLVIGNVINWTLSERNRRVDLQVGVAYGTDLEAVIKLLVEVATSHPNVVRQPAPVALFTGFGESSLDFELRFWAPHVRTYQQLKSEVAIQVWSAFREAGIEIPFPQREVLLKSPDAAVEETPLLQEQSHVESEG